MSAFILREETLVKINIMIESSISVRDYTKINNLLKKIKYCLETKNCY